MLYSLLLYASLFDATLLYSALLCRTALHCSYSVLGEVIPALPRHAGRGLRLGGWRGTLPRGAVLAWHRSDCAVPVAVRVQLPRSTWSSVVSLTRAVGGSRPPERLSVVRPGLRPFTISLEHRRRLVAAPMCVVRSRKRFIH